MKKVAIYVRISTQMQHSDRQVEELTSFAENENFEVVEVYKDVLSGFKNEEERPSLAALLEDSKTDKFDIILFSEFSRLSRRVGDLTNLIAVFQDNNKEIYFQKQNIWVRAKNDIGTSILIQVLGVVASYEIELFAERSVSGKISAIKNRGITEGGLPAYGYKSELGTKRLVVHEEEAQTIRRIFSMYAEGNSSVFICNLLNSEGVKSPYAVRIEETTNKRKEKGLDDKEYIRFDKDDLIWLPATLVKIMKNPLYRGVRKYKFHKPNPTKKNIEREILDEFEQYEKRLQIIDDVLFEQVQQMIEKNRTNKDNNKYDNLLRPLIKCGCCGLNYQVAQKNDKHSYKCYGKTQDRNKIIRCKESYEVMQDRLDGLVIQLSIRYIASNNLKNSTTQKIEKLEKENNDLQIIINSTLEKIKANDETWIKFFNKAVKFDMSDNIIEKQKNEYQEVKEKLNNELNNYTKQVTSNKITIESLSKLSDNLVLSKQIEKIKSNPVLLKELIYKYVTRIELNSLTNRYSLVKVTFIDNLEVWGSIKSAKYRNEEKFWNPTNNGIEMISLFYINNNTCRYNQNNQTFEYEGGNEDLKGVENGIYSATDFVNVLYKNDMNISFTDYVYNQLQPKQKRKNKLSLSKV